MYIHDKHGLPPLARRARLGRLFSKIKRRFLSIAAGKRRRYEIFEQSRIKRKSIYRLIEIYEETISKHRRADGFRQAFESRTADAFCAIALRMRSEQTDRGFS
jgi:hypothetical protein